jgi:hypothetical protein
MRKFDINGSYNHPINASHEFIIAITVQQHGNITFFVRIRKTGQFSLTVFHGKSSPIEYEKTNRKKFPSARMYPHRGHGVARQLTGWAIVGQTQSPIVTLLRWENLKGGLRMAKPPPL